jgi:Flp pilus assembly protein TadD
MPTTLIIIGVISIIQIALFIIFIIMLIKQFKHGGALHGIIGLITFGFWTFIWGWMKAKSLALTKTMIVWTLLMITPWVLIGVFGFTIVNEIVTVATTIMQGGGFDKMLEDMDKKGVKKVSSKKSKKTSEVARRSKKSSTKSARQDNTDWGKAAVALWQEGKYTDPQKALGYWTKAIRKNPKSSEAYNNRGLAYYNLKRYQQAVKDYSQAIRMNPEDAIAYNNRGNAYYEMMKYEPAESDYNKSLTINPQYANAYMNRGLVYYQMDKTDQACADLERACELKECEGMQWAAENGVCKES